MEDALDHLREDKLGRVDLKQDRVRNDCSTVWICEVRGLA